MLALTPAAVEVVATLTSATDAPDTAGLRIANNDATAEAGTLRVELVAGPAESDQVVAEGTGARVYLEPTAADFLADKVLDGELDDQGRARFAVSPQPGNAATPPQG